MSTVRFIKFVWLVLINMHEIVKFFIKLNLWSLLCQIIRLTEAATEGVLPKRCSEKFRKVPRKTFLRTLLKKRLWHGCFSVNFEKFLRTSFFKTPSVPASRLSLLVKILKKVVQFCMNLKYKTMPIKKSLFIPRI